MKKTKFFCIVLMAGLIFAWIQGLSEAASFDCTKAKSTLEKTICNDSHLSEADARLGKIYSQLRKSLPKSQSEKLKQEQLEWAKQRTRVCPSADAACLLALYEKRMDELNAGVSSKENTNPEARRCYDKAVTQLDLNDCAALEAETAERELNSVYQAVLKKHSSDSVFINNLKQAHQAWIAFRDASMEALYPHREDYGSVFPMCWSMKKAEMSRERTKQLRPWLDGVEQGDACSGSYPMK